MLHRWNRIHMKLCTRHTWRTNHLLLIRRAFQSLAGIPADAPLDFAATVVQYFTALRPETRPKTTQSRRELPPRRLVPWTPPIASPATNRPGMTLLFLSTHSAPSFILMPPMQ